MKPIKQKRYRVWTVVLTSKPGYEFGTIYAYTWAHHEDMPYVPISLFRSRSEAREWKKNCKQECWANMRVVSFYIPAPKEVK